MIQNTVIQKKAAVRRDREHARVVGIADGDEILVRVNIVGNVGVAVHESDILEDAPVDHKAERVSAEPAKHLKEHALGEHDIIFLEHRPLAGDLEPLLQLKQLGEIVKHLAGALVELDSVLAVRKILPQGKALSRAHGLQHFLHGLHLVAASGTHGNAHDNVILRLTEDPVIEKHRLDMPGLKVSDTGLELAVIVEDLSVLLLLRRKVRAGLRGALELIEEQKRCNNMLADPAVLRKVRAGAGTGQLIRKAHCHLVIVIALDRKLVDALVL